MQDAVYDARKCKDRVRFDAIRTTPPDWIVGESLGVTAKAVELDGNSLRVLRRRGIEVVSLQAVSAAPSVRRGVLASRLVVPVADAADMC